MSSPAIDKYSHLTVILTHITIEFILAIFRHQFRSIFISCVILDICSICLSIRLNKKNCLFPVTRPTLFFYLLTHFFFLFFFLNFIIIFF